MFCAFFLIAQGDSHLRGDIYRPTLPGMSNALNTEQTINKESMMGLRNSILFSSMWTDFFPSQENATFLSPYLRSKEILMQRCHPWISGLSSQHNPQKDGEWQ